MKRNKRSKITLFHRKTMLIFSLCVIYIPIMNIYQAYAKEKSPIVIIDPGHGGVDSGTQHGNILEKDIVLSISKQIEAQLRKDHITVFMTRETDEDMSGHYSALIKSRHRKDLYNRVRFFHEHHADLVISLHVNHSGSANASGGNVFFQRHHPFSAVFAPLLQDSLNTFYHNKEYPLTGPYYILRASKVPVFLVEMGFLSNPRDRAKLTNLSWQHSFAQKMAKTIELGLLFRFQPS